MIDDPIRDIGELLREAGARVTLDMDRNVTHPCVRCRTTSEPRDLVQIGTYTRSMGGGLQPGDAIVRPLCAACREATEPRQTPEEIGPHEMVGDIDCERCGEGMQHYLHTDRDASEDEPAGPAEGATER